MSRIAIARGDVVCVAATCGGDAAQFAAREIERVLERATGAQPGNADRRALTIRLLESRGEAYCTVSIDTDRREVSVSGRTPEAIRDGALDFLEKVAGVRWLYPGNEGEFIPETTQLRLESSSWTLPEPMPYRGLHICTHTMHYDRDIAEWMAHRRCNRKLTHHSEVDALGSQLKLLGLAPDTTTHSFAFLIPDATFYETHPEYFSLVGGRRIRHADGGQLCLANPALRKEYIARLAAFAAAHPDVPVLGIPSNDGFGWCECEACRRMDAEAGGVPGDVSGRVWVFSIEVADALRTRVPDRLVGQYVYSNFRHPALPALPGNMLVAHTMSGKCFRHSLGDPSCKVNERLREEILGWRRRCSHLYLYEYYFRASWGDMPFPLWRNAAEDMKWCRQSGVDGFLSEVVRPDDEWWRSGHMALSSALASLADPGMDIDAFLDDYCLAGFGPAAGTMRKYFDLLEDAVERLPCGFVADAEGLGNLLNQDTRRQCGALIEQAAASLSGSSAFHKRQFGNQQRLFEKWRRIADLQAVSADDGRLNATPFPGWDRALARGDGKGMAVLTTRSYHIPPDEGRTWLRAYYDTDSVYFAFDCLEPDMRRIRIATRENDLRVYEDDSIEVFTATSPGAAECAHFLVNPAGFKAASWCDIPRNRWNWSWPVSWEARAGCLADRWTAVVRIARKDIGAAEGIYFTVVRNRRAGGRNEISGFPGGGVFFRTDDYCAMKLAVT